MLIRFHLISERYGRMDGQTDGRTDRQICYINIARQYERFALTITVKRIRYYYGIPFVICLSSRVTWLNPLNAM